MSVLCPPALQPPPGAPAAAPIENDGWFPDIDPTVERAAMRIREGVTAERLRAALVAAILTVGNQLWDWQVARRAVGHGTLAAVPAPTIDGQSRLVLLYRRAVACTAKAELVEHYRDVDLTGAGQRKVEEAEPSIAELRRDALHAIRDMLGATRTTVELI